MFIGTSQMIMVQETDAIKIPVSLEEFMQLWGVVALVSEYRTPSCVPVKSKLNFG